MTSIEGKWKGMARPSLPSSMDSTLPGISRQVLSVSMEPKYQCQKCQEVLRKPFQAQCGHRFCVYCFKQLTSSGPIPCEACREEGIFEEEHSILNFAVAFPDNAARREIDGLPAKCPNEGCTWAGTLKDYEVPRSQALTRISLDTYEGQHEGRCEFERIKCEACQVFVLLSEKDRHNERECEARNLNCKYCKVSFSFKDIKAHDEICQKFPMQCKDCGKKKIPREKYQEHSKSCAKSKSACQFSEIGCRVVVDNGKQQEHEQSSVMEHLRLMLAVLSSVRIRSDAAGEWQDDSGLGLYRSPEDAALPVAQAAAGGPGMQQKMTALENIVCVLNREVERSALTLEALSRQHRLDQDKIENLSNKVRQLERTLNMRDLQLNESEQNLRELQFCTYDGVFIWKISDFSRRRQDALAGRAPAMFSPAFYSSKYGYKMCLRLYLNGDGSGRGTHLSLFFVVMRGKYDALLKWPFSQKVTLMLLDQNNREHIIDAFRPDISSTSFQRPISEMNIASGCPLFCPLAKLAGKSSYVRDDTIFIKAIVDLTGL
ncbi:TNF receptor-associated factor 2 isoform X3 [Neoarius graeffei]|nr:TNF receptor-associated factor 2 isoform X3 [Neoarius graeffei]XP_060768818.1 TNF receptor-associated factor 2 isoform X3 [Neoarius graeffei]